jgi:hypothetical protein
MALNYFQNTQGKMAMRTLENEAEPGEAFWFIYYIWRVTYEVHKDKR